MKHEHTRLARRIAAVVATAIVVALALPAARADDEEHPQFEVLVSTYKRLSFERDVARVAVADPEILGDEILTPREVLLLGQKPGRTTVFVWFDDDSTDFYLVQVKRDLGLLEEALKEIYPSITVQSAPDRDAVVLRGLVPDVSYSNAAEEASQRYLDARRETRQRAPAVAPAGEAATGGQAPHVEAVEATRASGTVINLIRVETLPGRLEDRMEEALGMIGTKTVRVRRLVRGRIPDDDVDIFVLEGWLSTQVDLVRAISVAQSMLGDANKNDIEVRADESGALMDRVDQAGGGQGAVGSRGMTQLFGGSGSTTQLKNLIEANLGRAKVVQAANGRLLSFVEVRDLPQVRVDIRLYEVNSSKLRQYRSNFGLLLSNFTQPSIEAGAVASAVQGNRAANVGAQGNDPDVQNVFGFLAGTLSNRFQLSGDDFAVDSVLSLLESKGWARSLSRPSLTVLSGERAFFQVGGEIPVPESFNTNIVTDGILNSVTFKQFGVQLSVRPLVGENGRITMDVLPEISLPDAQLTAAIRSSTGRTQETTAFRTRYLRTTALLDDGQALLIGGILSRNMQSTKDGTPGISDLPLIGGLFDNYSRDGDEVQLVIVVHPVVERQPTNKARLWAYPDVHELMRGVRPPELRASGACR